MRYLLPILALSFLLISCYPKQSSHPPPEVPVQQAPTGEQMCGGIAGAVCSGTKEYCHMAPAAQCGAADQTGVCRTKPEICNQMYAPVCGCDDRTYSNACTANGNGISVAYEGEYR